MGVYKSIVHFKGNCVRLFFIFFPIMVYYRIFNIVPWCVQLYSTGHCLEVSQEFQLVRNGREYDTKFDFMKTPS